MSFRSVYRPEELASPSPFVSFLAILNLKKKKENLTFRFASSHVTRPMKNNKDVENDQKIN